MGSLTLIFIFILALVAMVLAFILRVLRICKLKEDPAGLAEVALREFGKLAGFVILEPLKMFKDAPTRQRINFAVNFLTAVVVLIGGIGFGAFLVVVSPFGGRELLIAAIGVFLLAVIAFVLIGAWSRNKVLE